MNSVILLLDEWLSSSLMLVKQGMKIITFNVLLAKRVTCYIYPSTSLAVSYCTAKTPNPQ